MVNVVLVLLRVLEYRKRTLWPVVCLPLSGRERLLVTSTDIPPNDELMPTPTLSAV
ncbi:hypothetical protein D3C77_264770 [compost metagenome]